MPSFVVLEFGEKSFLWVGWAHFDTNYQVTPTFVRLGRAVTTILAEFRGGVMEMDLIKRNNFQMFFVWGVAWQLITLQRTPALI